MSFCFYHPVLLWLLFYFPILFLFLFRWADIQDFPLIGSNLPKKKTQHMLADSGGAPCCLTDIRVWQTVKWVYVNQEHTHPPTYTAQQPQTNITLVIPQRESNQCYALVITHVGTGQRNMSIKMDSLLNTHTYTHLHTLRHQWGIVMATPRHRQHLSTPLSMDVTVNTFQQKFHTPPLTVWGLFTIGLRDSRVSLRMNKT